MIYAIGLDTDRTFLNFLHMCRRTRAEVMPLNLRAFVERGDWALDAHGASHLTLDGMRYVLSAEDTFYVRIINLSRRDADPLRKARWDNLTGGLSAWLEVNGAVVINRPRAGADNGTKPLHEAKLARAGFRVPHSLTSARADALHAFAADGPTIVKTICGVRANCRDVSADELHNYCADRGPVHLQRKVSGADLRVHVVGDVCFGLLIESGVTDYRAAPIEGHYSPHRLPPRLAEQIVCATRHWGLLLAGWDFKIDGDGEYWALEANPMPGYDTHDSMLAGAITAAMVCALKQQRVHDVAAS